MRHPAIRVAVLALFLLAVLSLGALAAAPTIAGAGVSGVGTHSATLQAQVNPGNKNTVYHFEYGLEDCSVSTCSPVPVPDGKVGAATSPVPVEFQIEGLALGTTYHLRVVAKNADGEVKSPDRVFATHVVAFEGLPDGRAYEQASPVKKNAADARGLVAWAKAADDGSGVGFLSTSGIPGGEGAQEIPAYLATRGAGGWSTQGLLPPAKLGTEAFVRGWLPDFSAVFDFANDFGGGGGDGVFVSRSSADGTLAQIVGHGEGLGDDVTYAGASADGSKVVFEAQAKLACCEAAVEGESNVYLWDRDSGETSLVSVLNDGQSPPQGAFAGPYDWMTSADLPVSVRAGGAAASYYTQDPHPISADAGTVHFTAAGEGQLYARVNPTAAQSPLDGEGGCTDPALACTLELSATRRTPPDPLGSRPAAFMAATPEGSSTFFTSPEELTDDANTGPVQPAPAIERAAVGGEPVLAKLPITAGGIALDGGFIYWVDPNADAIGRVRPDGEDEEPTFIDIPPLKVGPEEKDEPANPQYVAVDGKHIYWTNAGLGKDGEGTIGLAKLDGDPDSVEVEWIRGASRPQGVAVNATHVFWANAGGDPAIGRAGIGGGEVEQVFINAVTSTEDPQGVALSASHVYWTANEPNGSFGTLRRNDIGDGLNQAGLFMGNSELRGIALDAGHVYWASPGDEAIGRIALGDFPLPGQGKCELIVSCEKEFIPTKGAPKGLALNATDLYWSVNGETPPNPGNDLYLHRDGELSDLTAHPGAVNGAEVKGVLGASEDGRRIYFVANGDLDGGGGAAAGGCRGEISISFIFNGQCSLYLAEEGAPGAWSTSFIARLDASGLASVSDAMNWAGRGSTGPKAQDEKTARVSADGGVLLFRSQRRLGAYDNEGQPELYRFEVGEGLGCVSCNPSGEAPRGGARLASIGLSALEPSKPALVLSRNLSIDGSRVFFETNDPLVIDDTNGEDGCGLEGSSQFLFPTCQDVYMWEAQGTGSCNEDVQGGGCLYLLSTGTSPNASFFADASLGGEDAFIATRSAGLVRQDQDQLQDIFDLRVGGGLASQNEPDKPICESIDGCHGPAAPPPGFQSPASSGFSGPGNKKQAHRKAKKRRHGKPGRKGHGQKTRRAAAKSGRSSR